MRDEDGIRRALSEARAAGLAEEIPVGAVVVQGDTVVAAGRNRIIETGDPTAHAEMLAIRAASEALNSHWLNGCTVYVTLEPCAMCAGALVLARISRLVFGATDPKTGACGSLRNIVADPRLNHRIPVTGGVQAAECGDLLKAFFKARRPSAER